jgi:glycosyltransferase involved in cell wall biosynthesis
MAKKLTVIIPTAGRTDLFERTVKSLSKCRKPSIYHETVVVENGCKTDVEDFLNIYRKSLNIRYEHIPVGNKSNALNAVLKTVDGSLVFFTDDDVRLDQGILEAYASVAHGTEAGEFYGGPFDVDYVRKPPEWLKAFLPLSAIGWTLGDHAKPIDRGSLFIGFNWAAFDRDIKMLGGFSVLHGPGSKIGAVGQETEMQKRLLESGLKGRYVPDARVWHYVPPERCSPGFAARRAYKWGIQGGLDYGGSMMSLLRRGIRDGFRTLLAAFEREPGKRFQPYYKLCYTSGMIKGHFIGRRNGLNLNKQQRSK